MPELDALIQSLGLRYQATHMAIGKPAHGLAMVPYWRIVLLKDDRRMEIDHMQGMRSPTPQLRDILLGIVAQTSVEENAPKSFRDCMDLTLKLCALIGDGPLTARLIELARAELEQTDPARDWQPIDTAPHEGTVLCGWPQRFSMAYSYGYWIEGQWMDHRPVAFDPQPSHWHAD